jgi:hypothetical protein
MGVDSHFKMKEEKDHDAKENKPQLHINNSLKSWGSNMKKFECRTNSQSKRNVHIVGMICSPLNENLN